MCILEWPFTDEIGLVERAISDNQIVLLPTETVYGLACRADSKIAVERLFEAKKRNINKKISLVIGNPLDLNNYISQVPISVLEWTKKYWPGPLTIILACDKGPFAGQTVGFRLPDHPSWEALFKLVSFPIFLTSANISGQSDVSRLDQVDDKIVHACKYLVKDDSSISGISSTVISFLEGELKILRQGKVQIN